MGFLKRLLGNKEDSIGNKEDSIGNKEDSTIGRVAVGDSAFFPRHGVGKVTGQTRHDQTVYLVWENPAGLKAQVPVDKIEETGLRHLTARDRASQLLADLGGELPRLEGDYMERLRAQMELIGRGQVEDNIQALKMAFLEHQRSKDDPEGYGACKRFKDTKALVVAEVSTALGRAPEEVDKEIEQLLGDAHGKTDL